MSILTTAIGLVLVYLILSLIASSIQETIASWFSLRGKYFANALAKMLTNKQATENGAEIDKALLEGFQQHNYFQNLIPSKAWSDNSVMGKATHPSYMSASTFATILLQLLNGYDVKELEQTIKKMNNGKLKTFLLDTLKDAREDLDEFRHSIEKWYDSVMSRVTGWYKRYSHNILIVIGLVLSGISNADSIAIYQKLSGIQAGSAQEQAVLNLAQQLTATRFDQELSDIQTSLDSADTPTDSQVYADNLARQNQQLLTQVDSLLKEDQSQFSALGLGWTPQEIEELKSGSFMVWFRKIIGFLITTFAISLGAPFWFDLLKKIVNIRNAGPIIQESTAGGPATKTST